MKEMITALRYVLIKIFLSKTETWLEAHDRYCLSPMNELIHHFTMIKISCLKAHDRHCLSPMKELITTSRYVLIKIFLCQRRKLDDSKDMIGIAYSMIRRHDRHCPSPMKELTPLYDMCWWRFSFLKDGNLIWSTWSALPFANERTDHHITISADQDFPFSKNGNSMIWSTWSALPFTNERTDHRFTVCADQDFPFSKTETDDLKLINSPAIDPYDLCSYWRKLDDLKHMIGIAFHQW